MLLHLLFVMQHDFVPESESFLSCVVLIERKVSLGLCLQLLEGCLDVVTELDDHFFEVGSLRADSVVD